MNDALNETWTRIEGVIWTHYEDSDDWVVCSPASAEVHLVTAAAHRLWLLTAGDPPRSLHDLTSMLASEFGRPVDAELAAATAATLAFMDEAGILRPSPSK